MTAGPILRRALTVTSCFISLACCSVPYDDVADKDISLATNDIDQQLETWATQAGNGKPVVYDEDVTKAYGKMAGDLSAIVVRIGNSPAPTTSTMADVAKTIHDHIAQTSAFHAKKKSIADSDFFIEEEQILNIQLGALSNYEQVLKGGASSSTASDSAKTNTSKAASTGK
jgi:hypothetical protein